MDFTTHKNDLVNLLSRAATAAAHKSPSTVLQCVCLSAEGDTLTAKATSHTIGVIAADRAAVKASGSACIDARRSVEIAKAMPLGPVRVRLVGSQCEFSAGKTKLKMGFIPGEDFPPMPELNAPASSSVDSAELLRVIAQGAVAMATDETHPEKAAALFEMEAAALRVASCDGHRMAYAECPISAPISSMLIPARAVPEVKRIAESAKGKPVELAINAAGYAFFSTADSSLCVKTLNSDGVKFVPYRKLPTKAKHVSECNVDALTAAIKRAAIAATDANGPKVSLTFSEGSLRASAANASNDDASDEIDCDCSFSADFAGNPAYLALALGAVKGVNARVSVDDKNGFLLVEPSDSKETLQLVMGMRK